MSDAKKAVLKQAMAIANIEQTGFDTSFIDNRVYHSDTYSTGQAGSGNDFIWNDKSVGATLNGSSGNDLFMGGTGGDHFNGSTGFDTAAYVNATYGVTVHLEATEQSLNAGWAAGDTLSSIENLVGSDHGDNLFGSSVANKIYGGDGDDVIYGKGGFDVLDGGNGFDIMYAGSGSYGDVADAGVGFEQLNGGGGNDIMFAGANADHFTGGSEDRFALGLLATGGGGDAVAYEYSNAAVTVRLDTGSGQGGWAQGDTYNGVEDVSGSRFNDTIVGNSADNVLEGRKGNDTLTGGAGHDTFFYDMTMIDPSVNAVGGAPKPNFGNDIITDFQAGTTAVTVGDQIFLFGSPDHVAQFMHQSIVGNDSIITSDLFDGSITLKNFTAHIDWP